MVKYFHSLPDTKFVEWEPPQAQQTQPLQSYKFRVHNYLAGKQGFDRQDVSIVFKVTPDSLVELCLKRIDEYPLPSVFEWTNLEVCTWLRKLGFPQYQNTFRKNCIEGRKLLLLDAAAIITMNIKDFDHIRILAQAIRKLFFFEMSRYGRSISLSTQYYYELYKLYRTKTGPRYELARRSDLWRFLQLVREKLPNLTHWRRLEQWLAQRGQPKRNYVLIGGTKRFNLYRTRGKEPQPDPLWLPQNPCGCGPPPCECHWTSKHVRHPWHLSCLPKYKWYDDPPKEPCQVCVPPCNCAWGLRQYLHDCALTILRETMPEKYDVLGDFRESVRMSVDASANFHRFLEAQEALMQKETEVARKNRASNKWLKK